MAEDSSAPVTDMTSTVDKKDPDGEGSISSTPSTPEPDQETYTQENPQTQKRKGGRKPIYATSEERKQRNRQAQAAFRERRTEYIKQLETTIKHHEENLQNLQQSHRSAADECLMLRYKNSLLERILLEKGIDVQAELQAKTTSPNLGPTRAPPPQATTVSPMQAPQRSVVNRHPQARRSLGMAQKVEGVQNLQIVPQDGVIQNRSPLSQPTSASRVSSPSTVATQSPNFVPLSGAAVQSPNFGPISQQQHHMRSQPPRPPFAPPQRPPLVTNHQNSSSISSGSANGPGSVMANSQNGVQSSFYPSPFQSHMDQLEQEYDAQADMIDEEPSDQSAGAGPFPNQFPTPQFRPTSGIPQPMPSNSQPYHSPATMQPADSQANHGSGNPVFQTMNNLFDPYDPMLDADPFGLSASMHFPTQFSHESR